MVTVSVNWQIVINEIIIDINAMCPIKVNSNTIELTVCVSLSTLLVIAS